MKSGSWKIALGVSLIVLAIVFYILHYFVFRDTRLMLVYFLGNLAFLPLQVLFVTLIIDQLLRRREKRQMLEKMNMVIGTFFSEMGTKLLHSFFDFDICCEDVRDDLIVRAGWTDKDFARASGHIRSVKPKIDSRKSDLEFLRSYLLGKRTFLLGLLENPVLLEHDSFTQLLWAVFHVKDELSHRDTFVGLPERDYDHLSADIHRAYSFLILEWLDYMLHLKKDYPYLFSLALRANPFDPEAKVILE